MPQARLVPIEGAKSDVLARIAEDRTTAFGMFADAYKDCDIDLASMKRDRIDYDEKFRLNLASDH